jgi:hypothetical protein
MAVNTKKLIASGAARVDYGVIGTGGYFLGPTAVAPAAGDADGAAAAQLVRVKNFPFAPSETQRNTVTGDNAPAGQFLYEPVELPNSNLEFGAADYDFEALVTSMKVYDLGDTSIIGIQPAKPRYRDIIMIVQSDAKVETEDADAGSSIWEGLVVCKSNIQPMNRNAFQERTDAAYMYNMVANRAGAFPWGELFTTVNVGTTRLAAWRFSSPYRRRLQRWTGNNVVTSFNLEELPVANTEDEFLLWVDGVKLEYTTGFTLDLSDPSAPSIEFVVAPAADSVVIGWFGCANS